MKFFCLILTLISISSPAQLTKSCFDKNGVSVDESISEYCTIGRAHRILSRNTRDSIWVYVDTVRAYFTGTTQLKFIKVYDAKGVENGNNIEFYPNGKIKYRGSVRNGERAGYFT